MLRGCGGSVRPVDVVGGVFTVLTPKRLEGFLQVDATLPARGFQGHLASAAVVDTPLLEEA